jgi:hypothetical protein
MCLVHTSGRLGDAPHPSWLAGRIQVYLTEQTQQIVMVGECTIEVTSNPTFRVGQILTDNKIP